MAEKNRYNHTKIYKLVDQVNQYFYIGSTTNSLSKRRAEHKADSLRQPDRLLYKHFNKIGWESIKIILIEEHTLENKDQQMREEDKIIQQYINDDKCLNSNRACHNSNEYYQLHKEERLENNKIWKINNPEQTKIIMKKCYDKNREKYLEQKRQSYICDCGAELAKGTRKKFHEQTKKHQEFLKNNETKSSFSDTDSMILDN